MSKMSCRECSFIKVRAKDVDNLIEKVKSAITETGVPLGCDINVYKNVYACCGVGGIGLIVEVTCPGEEKLKAVDLKAVSKIIEICEKEGLEQHTLQSLEIM